MTQKPIHFPTPSVSLKSHSTRGKVIDPQLSNPHLEPEQAPTPVIHGSYGYPYSMRPKLYVATTNAGKLRDFAHASVGEAHILPLPGLANIPAPVEDADTFEGNARIKAIAYSLHAPGHVVLADDSGIELDALGGQPGVHSARYAKMKGFVGSALSNQDDLNNECLLIQARYLAGDRRRARYRCVIAAAINGKVLVCGFGALEGYLLDTPRGTGGFGYDPLFLLPHLDLTMGELTPEARLHYSHRVRALADLMPRHWVAPKRKAAQHH